MKSNKELKCFKAYDVRGKLGNDLNEDIVYRIARATATYLKAENIVVGFDARQSSPNLAKVAVKAICDAGSNALEIGLAGTEEMYWSVSLFNADAGIEITASHNPIEYNGMKIVKKGSQPLSEEDFSSIRYLAECNSFKRNQIEGLRKNKKKKAREGYLNKIISFVDEKNLKPLKIVINSGNGAAGPVIDALEKKLKYKGVKLDFVRVHHEPDPSFPNGIPNPLIFENRSTTTDTIKLEKADFGVAFDGDFDRCFLFDHLGNFVPGEYIVGLIAQIFLTRESGATIVHDRRVIWNTLDVVKTCGGKALSSKTGHAFVKSEMRKAEAIYGGEMSAHHYFRDFAYCDSGMVPWLLIWELLSLKNISLADLVYERQHLFPSSGEINFTVENASKCMNKVKNIYSESAYILDQVDGLSMSFAGWRFNLRQSNTEPLVRLNVETTGDLYLLQKKISELKKHIISL